MKVVPRQPVNYTPLIPVDTYGWQTTAKQIPATRVASIWAMVASTPAFATPTSTSCVGIHKWIHTLLIPRQPTGGFYIKKP